MSHQDIPAHVAHPWHGIPADLDDNGMVTVFIELMPGEDLKFELDKPSGWLRIDRPQKFASRPPAWYGLIPRTYCAEKVGARCTEMTGLKDIHGDGDPMDIVVLAESAPAYGGLLARARVIGGLRMVDDGEADDKIVTVLKDDPVYGEITDIESLPRKVVDRLHQYFLTYKQPPEAGEAKVSIEEIYGHEEALRMVRLSEVDYDSHFGG